MGSGANSTIEGPKQGSQALQGGIIRLELSGKGGKEGGRGEIKGGKWGEIIGDYRAQLAGGRRDQHAI